MKTERRSVVRMMLRKNSGFMKPVVNKAAKFQLVLLALVCGLQPLTAQNNFQWGVKAGINASTQSEPGNLFDNDQLVYGFNGGLVARYGFNNWLGVRSGIDFQACGTQLETAGNNTDSYTRLNYLVLPVKAEFSASEKAGFKNGQRIFFATGPYGGYLLNAKLVSDDVKTSVNEFRNFDFGWDFELGFEFPVFKANAVQFSLNYNMGMNKLIDGMDERNKSASLNAIFLF